MKKNGKKKLTTSDWDELLIRLDEKVGVLNGKVNLLFLIFGGLLAMNAEKIPAMIQLVTNAFAGQ